MVTPASRAHFGACSVNANVRTGEPGSGEVPCWNDLHQFIVGVNYVLSKLLENDSVSLASHRGRLEKAHTREECFQASKSRVIAARAALLRKQSPAWGRLGTLFISGQPASHRQEPNSPVPSHSPYPRLRGEDIPRNPPLGTSTCMNRVPGGVTTCSVLGTD